LIGWKRIAEQLNSNRIGRLSVRESALVNESEYVPGLPFQTNEKKKLENKYFILRGFEGSLRQFL